MCVRECMHCIPKAHASHHRIFLKTKLLDHAMTLDEVKSLFESAVCMTWLCIESLECVMQSPRQSHKMFIVCIICLHKRARARTSS